MWKKIFAYRLRVQQTAVIEKPFNSPHASDGLRDRDLPDDFVSVLLLDLAQLGLLLGNQILQTLFQEACKTLLCYRCKIYDFVSHGY